MSLELFLFLLVATVAIFAAACMLVSRNAVHSALFLVINMICLSFFYLILNSPFLAMVQITVYAGAIMVLFMFVIMLMGAEQPEQAPTRFKWMPLVGVGLATVFLITVFFAITQGSIGTLTPAKKPPQVRVLNAGLNVPAVTVFLNDQKLANSVATEQTTDFQDKPAGSYNALVFAPKADGSPIDPGTDAPLIAIPVTLEANSHITLVATADKLIVVPQDLTTIQGKDSARLTVVNAFPGDGSATLLKVEAGRPFPTTAEDQDRYLKPATPALKYGDVSPASEIGVGDYDFAWKADDVLLTEFRDPSVKANYHELVVIYPQVRPGASAPTPAQAVRHDATAASFGGPEQIGAALFTAYLLPFELVSLLLLVAMVGAIILTREEVVKRERKRVIVSGGVHTRRLNQPANALTIQDKSQNAESSSAD